MGYDQDYKCHGTTTLLGPGSSFGLANAGLFNRRRRRGFLPFVNEILASYPVKEIHAVWTTLKLISQRQSVVSPHKNVHFHYAPTHAQWTKSNRNIVRLSGPADPQKGHVCTLQENSELSRGSLLLRFFTNISSPLLMSLSLSSERTALAIFCSAASYS